MYRGSHKSYEVVDKPRKPWYVVLRSSLLASESAKEPICSFLNYLADRGFNYLGYISMSARISTPADFIFGDVKLLIIDREGWVDS